MPPIRRKTPDLGPGRYLFWVPAKFSLSPFRGEGRGEGVEADSQIKEPPFGEEGSAEKGIAANFYFNWSVTLSAAGYERVRSGLAALAAAITAVVWQTPPRLADRLAIW